MFFNYFFFCLGLGGGGGVGLIWRRTHTRPAGVAGAAAVLRAPADPVAALQLEPHHQGQDEDDQNDAGRRRLFRRLPGTLLRHPADHGLQSAVER